MKKRGKILRDAKRGRGLLFVEGQQFPFSLPDTWRSKQPPSPGMSVEVEFGSAGEILAMRPLAEAQEAKEGRTSGILGRLLASIRRVRTRTAASVSLDCAERSEKALGRKSVGLKT